MEIRLHHFCITALAITLHCTNCLYIIKGNVAARNFMQYGNANVGGANASPASTTVRNADDRQASWQQPRLRVSAAWPPSLLPPHIVANWGGGDRFGASGVPLGRRRDKRPTRSLPRRSAGRQPTTRTTRHGTPARRNRAHTSIVPRDTGAPGRQSKTTTAASAAAATTTLRAGPAARPANPHCARTTRHGTPRNAAQAAAAVSIPGAPPDTNDNPGNDGDGSHRSNANGQHAHDPAREHAPTTATTKFNPPIKSTAAAPTGNRRPARPRGHPPPPPTA